MLVSWFTDIISLMTNYLIAQQPGQAGFSLGDSYTLADGRPVKDVFSKPTDIVNLLVPNLFVIAGITIMILIIVGGYKYIAMGQKGIQEASKIFGAALAGLIIMIAAYWIVQIIKLVTGADIPL